MGRFLTGDEESVVLRLYSKHPAWPLARLNEAFQQAGGPQVSTKTIGNVLKRNGVERRGNVLVFPPGTDAALRAFANRFNEKPEAKRRAMIVLESLNSRRTIGNIAARHGVKPSKILHWRQMVSEGRIESLSDIRERKNSQTVPQTVAEKRGLCSTHMEEVQDILDHAADLSTDNVRNAKIIFESFFCTSYEEIASQISLILRVNLAPSTIKGIIDAYADKGIVSFAKKRSGRQGTAADHFGLSAEQHDELFGLSGDIREPSAVRRAATLLYDLWYGSSLDTIGRRHGISSRSLKRTLSSYTEGGIEKLKEKALKSFASPKFCAPEKETLAQRYGFSDADRELLFRVSHDPDQTLITRENAAFLCGLWEETVFASLVKGKGYSRSSGYNRIQDYKKCGIEGLNTPPSGNPLWIQSTI